MTTADAQTAVPERSTLLAEFIAGSRYFDHCLATDYPPGLLDRLPPLEGAWSVHTHLLHLADAEFFAYSRCRVAQAEPGKTEMVWDEQAWNDGGIGAILSHGR
jgi:hypothetical protein